MRKRYLFTLEAAGAGEGAAARRGADAGAAATVVCSWAKAPAIRAITRTSRVTSFNVIVDCGGNCVCEGAVAQA